MASDEGVPEAWYAFFFLPPFFFAYSWIRDRLSRDAKNESSLFYTHHRDIHSVGIVLLQMLLGLDVTERYADVHTALQDCA